MTRLSAPLCASLVLIPAMLWAQPALSPDRPRTPDEGPKWTALFDGQNLDGWEPAKGFAYRGHDALSIEDGCLMLPSGSPATGARWTGRFPRDNYELELEGKRVEGHDFFCGLSFPVGEGELTLILGGWGGWVVGLSCIDGVLAVDNQTCNVVEFQNDRWYRIRIRVTETSVVAWVDDRVVCDLERGDHRLSVTEEMAPCLPLGIATWYTTGAIRGIRYRELQVEGDVEAIGFQRAQPVWPTGRETEMNLLVGYRAQFVAPSAGRVTVRIAAATVYRVWLNGQFLAAGPARGPHGYYRVDALDITDRLRPGRNRLAVEVAGYNVNSYDTLDQPSFLQAEVIHDGETVLAATGCTEMPFAAAILTSRVQKVPRYSFQRAFMEVYQLTPSWDAWRDGDQPLADPCELAVTSSKQLLPRRVLLPAFEVRRPVAQVARGRLVPGDPVGDIWKDRSLVEIGPQFKGYPEASLETVPSTEMQTYASRQTESLLEAAAGREPIRLETGDYHILDLGVNLTGMPGATVECAQETRFWIAFDEVLTDNDVDFKRLSCVNLITYQLAPGTYRLESLAPYTLRYLKLMCLEGKCVVRDVHLREYKHPPVAAQFECSDPQLNRLFEAGVETFRQNALDLFMDCPSRERAGWLCDSYFTARVAFDVTGTTTLETTFFENFLLPDRFDHLPAGMLPMCYPADHYDGVFIPNWALWFVIQLEEYAQRSGDRATVDALRKRVLELFDYFQPFENSDGLLEKLQGWVFIEWSAANQFVQDVNYPSNMLYAAALSTAGRLYSLPALEEKAEQIRTVIRQQSFDGQFFVDNAVREPSGELKVTRNRSEVCQYFAFFFDVATPTTHPELWNTLREKFGPHRKETKEHWDVHVANSFIGNMLRLELLSRHGYRQQILDESVAYLSYMADRTGTLWENDGAYASCNHGFASHIVRTLYRDVLGIAEINPLKKTVTLRTGDTNMTWWRGTLPTPDGPVTVEWTRGQDTTEHLVEFPEGYTVHKAGDER